MPEGIKNFSYNGTTYAVPDSQVDGFISRKPGAKVVEPGEGSLLLEHNGTKYNVPYGNVSDFLTRKPEAKAINNKSIEGFNGWAQGQQAQQEIYSGVKPAGVPYGAGMVTTPGQGFESTKEQPFPRPTAEEQKVANEKYNASQPDWGSTPGSGAFTGQVPTPEQSLKAGQTLAGDIHDIGTHTVATVKSWPDQIAAYYSDLFAGPKPGDAFYDPEIAKVNTVGKIAQDIAEKTNAKIKNDREVLQKSDKGSGAGAWMAGVFVAKIALNAAKLAVKMTLLMMLVSMWNKLRFPDEEDELSKFNDRQLKLILGRREDGSIITLRISGAFSDMLSYVGLEDAPQDIADVKNTKSTVGDKVKESGTAFINKLAQGSLSLLKTAGEVITGKSLYPDITNPKSIRDKTEHALRIVSLDKVYRYITKKPLKSIGEETANLILYNVDPGEAAYYTMRQRAFDFNKAHGVEFGSNDPTPKSNAIYYYKQSLKYGNSKLAAYWMDKYTALGGTDEGLYKSIDLGQVEMAVKKNLRDEWYESLDEQDNQMLEMANRWYDNTFLK